MKKAASGCRCIGRSGRRCASHSSTAAGQAALVSGLHARNLAHADDTIRCTHEGDAPGFRSEAQPLKKSGFEHPFQARQSRLGMAS
jgi:hypothetical protein